MTVRSRIRGVIVAAVCLFFFLGPAFSTPQNRGSYHEIIQSVAEKHRIDSSLIHSIIKAESNYDPWAVSPKGAIGLMQLMPGTAEEYGVKNIYDPEENIEGGVKYLKDLIRLYDGDADLVLAAYNAGQSAVMKYKGIPPYLETRQYITRIRATYTQPVIDEEPTRIYKFRDKNGRLVFTNDRNYYLANKKEIPLS